MAEQPGGTPRRGRPGLATLAVHAGAPPDAVGGPLILPIHQTSTFFNAPEGGDEILYTRYGNNPNQRALEARIAALEGAADCVVTGSGMSALAMALLSCLRAGERVLSSAALYGGTHTLLQRELPRLGIENVSVDFGDPGWARALSPGVRVVLLELPTNPQLRLVEVDAIAAAAHAHDAVVIVDSTFSTPINFRPLEHGADLVMHSATKYLGGHSDVTAGAIAGGAERINQVRERARIFGPALDPHAAWLVERGIKTLAVRMERHNRNGLAVSEWCEAHPQVRRVHYPGLASHPDHELARHLLDGFGGMMGIELAGGGAAATRFVRRLRLCRVAPSLGGVETLVSEPRHTSHERLSREEREDLGIPDGFIRFSLGIEDADDLIADIEAALRDE